MSWPVTVAVILSMSSGVPRHGRYAVVSVESLLHNVPADLSRGAVDDDVERFVGVSGTRRHYQQKTRKDQPSH